MGRAPRDGCVADQPKHSILENSVFVVGGCWVAAIGLAILAATGPNGGFAEAAGVFVIFAALILPLQLELSFARVNWDEANIYARSPWRPLRIIPFHAVRSCDYSEFWKWYRIHTEGYGTIRIQFFAVGIPNLFAVLPCPTPPYPPAVIG